MAKIYLSYSHKDRDLATEIGQKLKTKFKHQILSDIDVAVGERWRDSLNSALKDSDGILVLLSKNSLDSQYVFSEIGAARAYNEVEKRKFIIPVIVGQINIPLVIQDIHCIFLNDNNIEETIREINAGVEFFLGQLEVKREQKKERIEVEKEQEREENENIKENAVVYVEDTMNDLKKREQMNKTIGTIWYYIGFGSLFIGVALGLFNFIQTHILVGQDWVDIIVIAIKSIVIVGLLLACSKYSFTLGKTYLNESLKNANRLHAISFGKFYLNCYGRNVNKQEIKEVFQHWNIDKESQFSKLNPADFDPKFIELIVELSKIINDRAKK